MKRHFNVEIHGEMLRIKNKGVTALDTTPQKAFRELVEAQREGKTFYAGCENMAEDGKCAGHDD